MIGNKVKDILYSNDDDFNSLKAAEELSELAHALICDVTKDKDYHDQIVEELGDVMVRLQPIIQRVGWGAIQRRIDEKSEKILKWSKDKKYKRRV